MAFEKSTRFAGFICGIILIFLAATVSAQDQESDINAPSSGNVTADVTATPDSTIPAIGETPVAKTPTQVSPAANATPPATAAGVATPSSVAVPEMSPTPLARRQRWKITRTPTPTATPLATQTPTPAPVPVETTEEETTPTTKTEGTPLAKPVAQVDYQLKAKASVNPERESYPVNDTFTYNITVSWNGKVEEIIPSIPQKLDLDNLSIEKGPEKNNHTAADGLVQLIWTWELKPVSQGRAAIGAIVIPVTTRTGQELSPLRVENNVLLIGGEQAGWLGKIIAGIVALVVIVAVIWIFLVIASFQRKKQYQEAMRDSMPSADERLFSELTTLQVSLLRGNIFGYYEKLTALVRHMLKSRGVIEKTDMPTDAVVERMRAAGVDPAFLEMAESILHRCEAATTSGERPNQAAHEKIAQDMRALIRMKSGIAPPKPKVKKGGDVETY